jgi:hypothetical protein
VRHPRDFKALVAGASVGTVLGLLASLVVAAIVKFVGRMMW